MGFLEILLGCDLRRVCATECARARPFMWFQAQRGEWKRLAVFLSSSHCRVTHSAGSTVIRGKKTFHISVSPTALLRASQQGPTHLSFQPSSLLLSSYSSLCCCLALSHSDLMSGVVLNKSPPPPVPRGDGEPMSLLPASTITTLDKHTPRDTDCAVCVQRGCARKIIRGIQAWAAGGWRDASPRLFLTSLESRRPPVFSELTSRIPDAWQAELVAEGWEWLWSMCVSLGDGSDEQGRWDDMWSNTPQSFFFFEAVAAGIKLRWMVQGTQCCGQTGLKKKSVIMMRIKKKDGVRQNLRVK